MRSRRIGRTLGIGVRVAGRIAGQRLVAQPRSGAGAAHAQPASAAALVSRARATSASQIPTTGQVSTGAEGGLSKGIGGFFRPFRRLGGILWLEVTGVFFLLPVIVFAPSLWRETIAYSHANDHRTFWITAFVVAVFLYLGISSFWRARRR